MLGFPRRRFAGVWPKGIFVERRLYSQSLPKVESRREYLTHHRSARAWAALDRATNDQMKVTYDPYVTKRDSLNGKHVVVIGSGVGGLTTAYELLANNSDVQVTILEARNRTGGRCLTLRTGDTLTEDKNSDL